MKRAWWKETTVYQIYPRSFCDSDGDGVGDLAGIIRKADYLEDLGVGAVWLCPVYRSPNDDNGYDISDYLDINPEFGDMRRMESLIGALHDRKIRLIMDLVVNQTSDEHPWFRESRKSRDNPYRDYYIWRDGKNGGPPNNWTSRFSGSAWELDEATGQYYLHLFSKRQPDLNWENPKVREEVAKIVAFWVDKGVDGFRMDVINMISKTPGLPDDDPARPHRGAHHYLNGPRVHEYLRELNSRVLAGKNLVTVGETKGVDPETALLYVGEERGELDMVFQFEMDTVDMGPGGKWDIKPWRLGEFKRVMSRWQTSLHGRGWNSLYLENHDMPRAVSRFGDDGSHRERSAKLLACMLFTMSGTPFIYQGQEIGMTNIHFPDISRYRDVQTLNMYRDYRDNRNVPIPDILAKLHYRSRDNARTPMQWSDGPGAGFSTGTPWIDVNPNHQTINVARQLADPDSVLRCYRRLARLRRENDVLVYGDFTEHRADDEQIYAYTRTLGDDGAFVVMNFSGDPAPAVFPDNLPREHLGLVFTNVESEGAELEPWEARIYLFSNDRVS